MFTLQPHIQALIFDCDGTLADTMPLYYLAWQETVGAVGVHIPEPLLYKLAGAPSDKVALALNRTLGYQLDPQKTAHEVEIYFLNHMAKVKPVMPVVAIAKRYHRHLPMAVASSGARTAVQSTLSTIGLADFFDTVVTTEDVAHPKPAPDIFLEAARRLHVQPQHCHVFEDADLGLEAAGRAGMSATDVRLLIRNGKLNC